MSIGVWCTQNDYNRPIILYNLDLYVGSDVEYMSMHWSYLDNKASIFIEGGSTTKIYHHFDLTFSSNGSNGNFLCWKKLGSELHCICSYHSNVFNPNYDEYKFDYLRMCQTFQSRYLIESKKIDSGEAHRHDCFLQHLKLVSICLASSNAGSEVLQGYASYNQWNLDLRSEGHLCIIRVVSTAHSLIRTLFLQADDQRAQKDRMPL